MVLHNKIEACDTCYAVSKAGACRSFDRQHHTYPIQKKSRWSVARQHMTKSYFYESSYIQFIVWLRTRSAGGLSPPESVRVAVDCGARAHQQCTQDFRRSSPSLGQNLRWPRPRCLTRTSTRTPSQARTVTCPPDRG